MTCPQCGSVEVKARPYDRDYPEAGYSDHGIEYVCADCWSVSTEDEMDKANADQ
jgi:DNA-directed RNA polymerase subunit RPC12/RpoP